MLVSIDGPAQHGRGTIRSDDGHKVGCSAINEPLDGEAKSGDGAVVVVHHRIGKGQEHEKIEKPAHAEAGPALCGGKCLLNTEPDQDYSCQRKNNMDAHRCNGGCRRSS